MKYENLSGPKTETTESEEQELNQEFITTESFVEQFNQEHLLEIEGNDPVPYAKVEPENPVSEDWVVYVGGFGQGKESYLDEIQSLAHSGMKVLFTNPTRGIEGENELSAFEDVSDTIHNKVRALREILIQEGITSARLVGHSQGGGVVSTYDAEYPGVANKLVILNSAGSRGGNDSREKIMGRFIADKAGGAAHDGATIWKNTKQKIKQKFNSDKKPTRPEDEVTLFSDAGVRAGKSFREEVFKNLKEYGFRWKQETIGVAKFDIAPILKHIKQRGGTEITVVNANKDKIYTSEDFAKMFGVEEILHEIKEAEEAFKQAVEAGEKAEGDRVYSEELTEKLDNILSDGSFDGWANYSREAATHSEPVAGKAGLLVSILNPEQNKKEINRKLDQEQAAA